MYREGEVKGVRPPDSQNEILTNFFRIMNKNPLFFRLTGLEPPLSEEGAPDFSSYLYFIQVTC